METLDKGTLVFLNIETHNETGEVLERMKSIEYILSDGEFDLKLKKMQLGKTGYIELNAGRKKYLVEVKGFCDSSRVNRLEDLPFLRLEEVGGLIKRVTTEGVGDTASTGSAVYFTYLLRDSLGIQFEKREGAFLILSEIAPNPFYKELKAVLGTMKLNEECVFQLTREDSWVIVSIGKIIPNYDIFLPQQQQFLRTEDVLLSNGTIEKCVVREGEGELPQEFQLWFYYEGRIETGYQFQKPRRRIYKNSASTYLEAWENTLKSMKRGEKCWVKMSPEVHCCKDFLNDCLWYSFDVIEAVDAKPDRNISLLSTEDRICSAENNVEEGNRLYRNGIISYAEKMYNQAYTATTLKKQIIENLSEQRKNWLNRVRIQCMSNLVQVIVQKIKTGQERDTPKFYKEALGKCQEILSIRPAHLKTLYRKSLLLYQLSEYAKSISTIESALVIAPHHSQCKLLYKTIQTAISQQTIQEKKMYKGIFN